MLSLTWPHVHYRRLLSNFLVNPAPSDQLVAIVSQVCGIQAQVMASAELAISIRVADITREQVRQALWHDRSLVKTYGMRGTLHLLPADELPLWMAAMRVGMVEDPARWWAAHSVTPAQGSAVIVAIRVALDGRALTRDELASAVAEHVGDWAHERMATAWADLIIPAAYAGALCFGPNRGTKVTFVRPDQWLGGWHDIDSDVALREVLRRFLATYGPATRRDVARWLGRDLPITTQLEDWMASEVTAVDIEGHCAYLLAGDTVWETSEHTTLRLLPPYDCYLLGSYPREQTVPSSVKGRISSYGRGRFEGAVGLPVLLIDGRVAGIWERRGRGKHVEVRVEPFQQLTRTHRQQLRVEADRLAEFLGVTVSLSLGALG